MSQKGGLGRGLSSLIPNKKLPSPTEQPRPGLPAEASAKAGTVVEQVPKGERILHVSVNDIVPNPHQPRREFHPEELQDLAASIKEYGVLQPITVTEKANGMFELVAGERRLRASKAAGLAKIPVIIRSATEQEKLELALIENIQRADLSPIEEAHSYMALMEQFGMTQERVSERVGKSRSAVANILRLLKLPQEMQMALSDGRISNSMARVLCGMDEPKEQRAMYERMLQGDWTVRQAEHALRAKKKPQASVAHSRDVNVMALEEDLRSALGTRVTVENKGEKGRIVIEFYSPEELNGLVRKLRS